MEARVNLLIMAVIESLGWVLNYGRHLFLSLTYFLNYSHHFEPHLDLWEAIGNRPGSVELITQRRYKLDRNQTCCADGVSGKRKSNQR